MTGEDDRPAASVGQHVVVKTADGHHFRAVLLETRRDRHGRTVGVVRLETGWVTSYPMRLIEEANPA